MVRLVEGDANVSQANALVGLSSEVHKSIRQEFDMLQYASDRLVIVEGNKVIFLGPGDQPIEQN